MQEDNAGAEVGPSGIPPMDCLRSLEPVASRFRYVCICIWTRCMAMYSDLYVIITFRYVWICICTRLYHVILRRYCSVFELFCVLLDLNCSVFCFIWIVMCFVLFELFCTFQLSLTNYEKKNQRLHFYKMRSVHAFNRVSTVRSLIIYIWWLEEQSNNTEESGNSKFISQWKNWKLSWK